MARNIRDSLPWSPTLELADPLIPDFKRPRPVPDWIPPEYQPPPDIPDIRVWDLLIRGLDSPRQQPDWIQPPSFRPSPWPSPRHEPPTHDVDPPERPGSDVTRDGSGSIGGMLGLIHEAMRRNALQPGSSFDPDMHGTPALRVNPDQSTQPIRRLVRVRPAG